MEANEQDVVEEYNSEPLYTCGKCGRIAEWDEGGFRWNSIYTLARGSAYPMCSGCPD